MNPSGKDSQLKLNPLAPSFVSQKYERDIKLSPSSTSKKRLGHANKGQYGTAILIRGQPKFEALALTLIDVIQNNSPLHCPSFNIGLRLLLMRMTNLFCCDSPDAMTISILEYFGRTVQLMKEAKERLLKHHQQQREGSKREKWTGQQKEQKQSLPKPHRSTSFALRGRSKSDPSPNTVSGLHANLTLTEQRRRRRRRRNTFSSPANALMGHFIPGMDVNEALDSLYHVISGFLSDSEINVCIDMMIGDEITLPEDHFDKSALLTVTICGSTKKNALQNSNAVPNDNAVQNSNAVHGRKRSTVGDWEKVILETTTYSQCFFRSSGITLVDIGLHILGAMTELHNNNSRVTSSCFPLPNPNLRLPKPRYQCGKLLVICGNSVHDFNSVTQLVNAVIHELDIENIVLKGRSRSISLMEGAGPSSYGFQTSCKIANENPWIHFGINTQSYIMHKSFQGPIFAKHRDGQFSKQQDGSGEEQSKEKTKPKVNVTLDDGIPSTRSYDDHPDSGITWSKRQAGPVGETFHCAHLRAIRHLLLAGYNVVADEFWINDDWINLFEGTFADLPPVLIKVSQNHSSLALPRPGGNPHLTRGNSHLINLEDVRFPTPDYANLTVTDKDTRNPMACARKILRVFNNAIATTNAKFNSNSSRRSKMSRMMYARRSKQVIPIASNDKIILERDDEGDDENDVTKSKKNNEAPKKITKDESMPAIIMTSVV